ncbi:MAG: hypothetical protein IJ777_02035 [Clostridia bacterium]|nr:hypothetical protein [Clostridia bacterium]
MKKAVNIIKWMLLSLSFLTFLILGIAIMIPDETQQLASDITGADNILQARSKENDLRVISEVKVGNMLWKPTTEGGEEIYCVEPGTELKLGSTKEYIIGLVNSSSRTGPSKCGCASSVRYYGTRSGTYYKCVGEHYNESDSYKGKKLYNVAFIASYLPGGQLLGDEADNDELWAIVKQQAIWMSQICKKTYNKNGSTGQAQGELFTRWAERYRMFYQQIMQDKKGMKPKSLLSESDIKVDIDREENLYKIGPFKLDYINGKNVKGGNAKDDYFSYGGISNMYLVDDEGNKLAIKNFIIDGEIKKAYYGSTKNANPEKLTREQEENTYYSNWNPAIDAYDNNDIDWYASHKAAPLPGKEFYVEVDYPEELVGSVKLHVEFSYIKCEVELCMRDGIYYTVSQKHLGDYNKHTHHYRCSGCKAAGKGADGKTKYTCPGHTRRCHDCKGYEPKLGTDSTPQDAVVINMAKRTLVKETFEIGIPNIPENPDKTDKFIPITMKIGGNVFEEALEGKEGLADGILTKSDKLLANIEVSLYEINNGKLTLAELATLKEENPSATKAEINNKEDYTRRTNPTLTDENGYYEFRGVDVMKKYIVQYTYNGQVYMPTDYNVDITQYSSCKNNSKWEQTSKATELAGERKEFDDIFASIGSSPNNYISSNSLGELKKVAGEYYNETFSTYELAGITLKSNGKYEYDKNNQLIDTYLKVDKNGAIIDTSTSNKPEFQEGMISQLIRDYIDKHRVYPTNVKSQIYQQIAKKNEEAWKKLQFIEDCKINAYTKEQNANKVSQYDAYPVYDQFTISMEEGKYKNHTLMFNGTKASIISDNRAETFRGKTVKSKGKIEYKNIYPGQCQINLGLWPRQKAKIALRKDVYKAALQINGKTEVYNYNKRSADEELWEISARLSDASYYGTTYSRELYRSDYQFKSNTANELNIYATYKISIRNQSQSILTQIDEIVDYYDTSYTFMPNMSWLMYDDVGITKEEYSNIMMAKNKNIIGDKKFKNIQVSNNTNYGSNTNFSRSFLNQGYNTIYIHGLENHKMAVGEEVYLYLTFKINGSGSNLDIANTKHNIAEINGYSTFYANGTELPNGITKNAKNTAGLIDVDSNPGNLTANMIQKEYLWENDTDRAKGLKVSVIDSVREINGTVWEDKRNTQVEGTDAVIGNGIRENGETVVSGIHVELYEVINGKTSEEIAKIWNGTSWQEAKIETDGNGQYKFEGFIPGDYIVRFTYGGEYNAIYNGQDFKSTTYQFDIKQEGQSNDNTDAKRKYNEYMDVNLQNETATYGYNIAKADNLGKNVSDAKDIWTDRQKVNAYSSNGITNAKAEDLSKISTLGKDSEARKQTQMRAETGVIAIEMEYNRTNSNGDNSASNGKDYLNGNDYNGKYILQNIDFGLVERPKAQLELTKKISNVKITLANNNILFDANQSMNNILWKPSKEYRTNELKGVINSAEGKNNNIHNDYTVAEIVAYRNRVNSLIANTQGLIQATMDAELMHGATIQMTYDFTVRNVGEVDYHETSFYYTGKVADQGAIVKTSADTIIDYVENNLQYRTSSNQAVWGWKAITKDEINTNGYVNQEVSNVLSKYNTILATNALNKKLIPLTENTKKEASLYEQTYATTRLVLTQLITAENNSDDMEYNNTAEIVKISNDVGRRMAFSVQGNQNPTQPISEIDSARAEKVVILPPFGNLHTYLYIGLGATIAILLGTSIVFIKKKVLKHER